MNIRKCFLLTSALLLIGFLAGGCSSTPESRIQKNPEAFERLAAEDRERILNGEIAIGFTREMVLLALGEPNRTSTRTTAEGVFENWAYVRQRHARNTGYYHGFAHPRWYYSHYHRGYVRYRPFYPPPSDFVREEYVEKLIQFKEDSVVSFEIVEK